MSKTKKISKLKKTKKVSTIFAEKLISVKEVSETVNDFIGNSIQPINVVKSGTANPVSTTGKRLMAEYPNPISGKKEISECISFDFSSADPYNFEFTVKADNKILTYNVFNPIMDYSFSHLGFSIKADGYMVVNKLNIRTLVKISIS